jgi:hypothetical protein
MNHGAFTNDSLTMMYEVVRGALDADDTLKARGEEIRFRVRETAEWKKHAADLEMEMIKRGMIFEVINLVPRSRRASLIGPTELRHGIVMPPQPDLPYRNRVQRSLEYHQAIAAVVPPPQPSRRSAPPRS